MAWSHRYVEGPTLENLTDKQRQILAPPQESTLVEGYVEEHDVFGV